MTTHDATGDDDPTQEPSALHGLSVVLGPDRAALTLSGEVDVAAASSLRHRLRDLLVDGHVHVTVDLGGVTFLDSSGLGVLVSGQRQARMFRGSFTLVAPSQPVRRLLEITALDRVFEVRAAGDEP